MALGCWQLFCWSSSLVVWRQGPSSSSSSWFPSLVGVLLFRWRAAVVRVVPGDPVEAHARVEVDAFSGDLLVLLLLFLVRCRREQSEFAHRLVEQRSCDHDRSEL